MIFDKLTYNENIFFYFLCKGLKTFFPSDSFVFSREPDWNFIYDKSIEQGVLSFVYDGITSAIEDASLPVEFQPPRKFKLQWACNVKNIEETYKYQYMLSKSLVDAYAEQNIKTVVLKGFAVAQLYPKPNHRACGDFDCFLMGDYDRGNQIAMDLGADVDTSIKKHSHIVYKGFMIENHKNFTKITKNKRNNQFEHILHKVLNEKGFGQICNTNFLYPNPLFTALFLTDHANRHLMDGKGNSGIRLRHICDWVMLLKKYHDKIDWLEFRNIIFVKDKKMFNFAECVSILSHGIFGVPLPDIFVENDKSLILSEKLLFTIFYDKDDQQLDSKKTFKRGCEILKESLLGNWKENEFCEDPPLSLRKLHRTGRLILNELRCFLHI